MADKGFTIKDLLPLGVSLNIPPFLGQAQQMSPEDVVKTQVTGALRIKIKNFKLPYLGQSYTCLYFLSLIKCGQSALSCVMSRTPLYLNNT